MPGNYVETLRESVASVLGAPPDPAPLEPHVLDVAEAKGYRREHIKFQVSPNDWSYAYLLIPNNLRAAAPVVYCHHRHNNTFKLGKAEIVGLAGDKNEAIGVDLVKRGYIVFAPDALGFGERRSPDSDGDTFDLAYSFHQLALRLLRGETLLKKVICDISRGIDYLETRTEIDSRFIGFMGHGYGGKMAIWAMALDSRISAGVAHCGVVTYRENVRRGDWFQIEFVVPRLMQVADFQHILNLLAPRPCLISTTEDDPQSADADDIYRKTLPFYEKLGVANRLSFYRYPGGDALDAPMRLNAYSWLDSWLLPF